MKRNLLDVTAESSSKVKSHPKPIRLCRWISNVRLSNKPGKVTTIPDHRKLSWTHKRSSNKQRSLRKHSIGIHNRHISLEGSILDEHNRTVWVHIGRVGEARLRGICGPGINVCLGTEGFNRWRVDVGKTDVGGFHFPDTCGRDTEEEEGVVVLVGSQAWA